MRSSKKVVHLTTVHHPYDPRIYHKECKSLQEAGYNVTLIAPEEPSGTTTDKPVHHVKLKKYSNRRQRMTVGTWDAYKKAKEMNADVYHFHDPELLPVAWLLKNKHNTVIYDIHEDYVTSILQKNYLNEPAKKTAATLYKSMESFFIRNMELSLAEKYYKDIYQRGTCILNYPTINETFRDHYPEDSGPKEDKLLYTGNVSYVRGALIHAGLPSISPGVSVHFIGKCPPDLAEEMYAEAGDNKDMLNIEGIGRFIEKEEIEAKYLERNWLAGIALFPPTKHYARKELTKFFEYMIAGLPVLCSDFPVWKNFIDTYECGIAVDPYNEKEIAEAIDYLKNNPKHAKQMGANGKKYVLEKLNWHTEEQKLISWYDQLTGENETDYSVKDRGSK